MLALSRLGIKAATGERMTPHPCPYCNTEMNRTGDTVRLCPGCGNTEGAPADRTRQDTILPL